MKRHRQSGGCRQLLVAVVVVVAATIAVVSFKCFSNMKYNVYCSSVTCVPCPQLIDIDIVCWMCSKREGKWIHHERPGINAWKCILVAATSHVAPVPVTASRSNRSYSAIVKMVVLVLIAGSPQCDRGARTHIYKPHMPQAVAIFPCIVLVCMERAKVSYCQIN